MQNYSLFEQGLSNYQSMVSGLNSSAQPQAQQLFQELVLIDYVLLNSGMNSNGTNSGGNGGGTGGNGGTTT